MALGQQLVDATAFADSLPGDVGPEESLHRIIDALIETTIVNRTAGGLYRWEGRYLRADDQRAVAEQMKLLNRRLQRPLVKLRPKLNSRQRWTLSAATLSVIGSITDHRSRLGDGDIRATLRDITAAVLRTELPVLRGRARPSVSARTVTSAAGSYELVLYESMRLFNERGYRQTAMEDIAAAVGIPVASIYQYFPGKAEILATSYRRAADQLSGDLSTILAANSDPATALLRLIEAYVARSFADPELTYVYYTERHNLPESDALRLYNIQRSTVESWARLAVAARPELSLGRARYAVHAAFALSVEIARLLSTDQLARDTVLRLMEVTLLARLTTSSRPR